jgi:hypothetical protein
MTSFKSSWWYQQELYPAFEAFGGVAASAAPQARGANSAKGSDVNIAEIFADEQRKIAEEERAEQDRRVNFSCTISIVRPRGWIVQTDATDPAAPSLANLDELGAAIPAGTTVLYLAASTRPPTHKAQVLLIETRGMPITEQLLSGGDGPMIAKSFAQGASRIPGVRNQVSRIVQIANRPVAHVSYQRLGQHNDGYRQVDVYYAPRGSSLVQLTLSYALNEANIWKPTLDAVGASFSPGEGC